MNLMREAYHASGSRIVNYAGLGSGPPSSPGVRRGSMTCGGDAGCGELGAEPGVRGGSFSPRTSTAMSSRVNVSRSSSAAATACSRSMFS
jgi:hypothetical protein